MVDVGAKSDTERVAVAEGTIRMKPQTLALILGGDHKKGDVLGVARVAGIMAAKKTSELIPLCHPIPITAIEIEFTPLERDAAVYCRARVATRAKTGIEMEALTAVEIALLTIYDMCKAVDRNMSLTDIQLVSKAGGKSGTWMRKPTDSSNPTS